MKAKSPQNALRLITPYFYQNRGIIAIGLICLLTVDLLQLLIPRVVKRAVDAITLFETDLYGLLRYALWIMGLAVLIAGFRYVWRRCLIGLSRLVEEKLRNHLFAHLQTLSAAYFARTKTGDLMAHATNDLQHVRMATGMGVVALTDALFLGTAAIGFMAYIHLQLTLLVLIPMPLIVFGTRFFSKRMHRMYTEVQASFSDLTETVRERFAGIRIIKAYNREPAAYKQVRADSERYVRKNLGLVRITGAFFPMMMLFSNLSMAIILYFGGRQTILAHITPGDFVAFINYLGLITWPMMALGWLTNLVQRGKASLERIHRVINTPAEIRDRPDARPLPGFTQAIRFEDVGFAYPESRHPALSHIDLTIKKGETLGIVGPPGSGKSTLLHLIPRIFEVSQGRITTDGTPLPGIRLADLRDQVAFVPQEPFLFAGTIRENISFGDDLVSQARLESAIEQAALAETLKALPRGLETMVGERGVILSGGQKQRIALARALLRDRPVLILDDPISQVDTETGQAIIQAVYGQQGRRTLIIASHRIAAVRRADAIIVLENGRISESGDHDRLLNTQGYYARTFQLQEIEAELNAF